MKAIALLSGGLDSILATKLILKQGVEVEAVNFMTVFCNDTARGRTCLAAKSAADMLGVPLKVFEISKELLDMVKNPKHGYGSNMNPCIDCRIFIFKKAGEYMKETGASFIFTGEVLGERPMSQRKDTMRLIEKETALKGLIVRPLSAKLMEPSIPEKEGLVDREKFMDIKGRSRKPQIQLAKDFGIDDYPNPAGGCLLTDPGFAKRMRDLMKHKPDFALNDVNLLKIGRHFRFNPEAKFIVGRNDEENRKLSHLSKEADLHFYPEDTTGPTGIGRGIFDEGTILKAARIVARYSDGEPGQALKITCKEKNPGRLEVLPFPEEELNELRI